MEHVMYQSTVPIVEVSDVLVCGAGPAGIAAAIASSRTGARTVLLERFGYVGGSATAGLVGPFMTSFSLDGETQIIKGIFDELVTRMEAVGGAVHPAKVRKGSPYAGYYIAGHDHVTPFDPEIFKYVAMEMLEESGVITYLHTFVLDTVVQSGRVEGVVTASKSGLQAFHSKITIDCTADADIAAKSGAVIRQGRDADGLTQPMTLFFRVGKVDDEKIDQYVREHPEERGMLYSSIIEKALEAGNWLIPRNKIGMYLTTQPGVWRINTTRLLKYDGTSNQDLSRAEVEGRKQMMALMKFFHENLPGFEQAVLVDSGAVIGIRESRRIVGEYVLELDDLIEGKHFDDVIALCSYPVDIHSPTGSDGGMRHDIKTANIYELPYRILVPQGVDGLLVAGRCVSATHEALGAIRVMPPVFAMGQAAGTAAAFCAGSSLEPRAVNVAKLQNELLRQNVVLNKEVGGNV